MWCANGLGGLCDAADEPAAAPGDVGPPGARQRTEARVGQGGRASVARAEMLTTEEAEGVAQGALRLALHSDSGRRRSAGEGEGRGREGGGVGLDRGGLEICRGGREAARSALDDEGHLCGSSLTDATLWASVGGWLGLWLGREASAVPYVLGICSGEQECHASAPPA